VLVLIQAACILAIVAVLEGVGRWRPAAVSRVRRALAARLSAVLRLDDPPWRVALALAVGRLSSAARRSTVFRRSAARGGAISA